MKKKNLLHRISAKRKIRNDVHPNDIAIGYVNSNLGGVPHHIHSIAQRTNRGISIIPNPDRLEELNELNLHEYLKLQMTDSIQRNSFKLIHTHVDPWFIDLANSSLIHGVRWVHTYHTLYFERDWSGGLKKWQIDINNSLINVAKNANTCITISHWLQNLLKEKYGINTVYIPNGVDVKKCDSANPEAFFRDYGKKDFVLFASGISDIKNPIEFVRLADAMPEEDFVIIGRKISKSSLEQKFGKMLPSNLFVIGQLSHSKLLDAIAACKVFVVTSRSEGLPTVLMEAMALERSVVGCDTFGTKEVISGEAYGYLYNHKSFEDLVAKTKMALQDSKGIAARRRILENYDWEVVIPQLNAVYSDLIAE